VGRLNKLKEHWARVHFKESKDQRFRLRTGAYQCPVFDCEVTGITGRKAFTSHIKDEHHHPADLLACGIECWHYLRNSPNYQLGVLEFLINFGLVRRVPARNDAYRQLLAPNPSVTIDPISGQTKNDA